MLKKKFPSKDPQSMFGSKLGITESIMNKISKVYLFLPAPTLPWKKKIADFSFTKEGWKRDVSDFAGFISPRPENL